MVARRWHKREWGVNCGWELDSFGTDENVLELVVMISQLGEYTKNHGIIFCKWMDVRIWELYLSTVIVKDWASQCKGYSKDVSFLSSLWVCPKSGEENCPLSHTHDDMFTNNHWSYENSRGRDFCRVIWGPGRLGVHLDWTSPRKTCAGENGHMFSSSYLLLTLNSWSVARKDTLKYSYHQTLVLLKHYLLVLKKIHIVVSIR